MTNPPWHVTHDADGQYRDPVERWRQREHALRGHTFCEGSDEQLDKQLMSDLAALCEELSVYHIRPGSCERQEANAFRKRVMQRMYNSDSSPRFPAKEKA